MSRMTEARIVAICFLAHNCSMGILYGTFGPLITTIQREMETSRGLASMGLSAATLSLGIVSPAIGMVLRTISVRKIMSLGAILSAIGYMCLAFARDIYQFIAIYAVLIGPGLAALSIIPPSTLISRWFVRDRGKALGLVFTPVFAMLVPLLTSFLVQKGGMAIVFLTAAAAFALLLPAVYFMVIETPQTTGLSPRGMKEMESETQLSTESVATTREILAKPQFWIMGVAVALLMGAASAVIVQTVPFLISRGIELSTAATTFSISIAVGIFGAFTYGWLSDRIGPVVSFSICAVMLAVPWLLIIFSPPSVAIYILVLGWSSLCFSALTTLHAGTASDLFGAHLVSRVLGINYFVKLPFLVSLIPIAGFVFDRTGSYDLAFGIFAGMAFLAGAMLISLNALPLSMRRLPTN